MKHRYLLLTLLLLFLLPPAPALRAQGLLDKVTDLLEFNVNGRAVARDSSIYPAKFLIAPIAYYEPATSLGFGVGTKLLFKPRGASKDTRTSNIPIGITYTLNNQFFFSSGFTIFFNEEKWLLDGDLNFSSFPQGYYGVGNLTTEEDRTEISFNQFLIQPLLLKRIRDNYFLGGGVRFNNVYNTTLAEATDELPEGFDLQDSLGSRSVGGLLAFRLDTRDNVLNATRGSLLEVTHGVYGEQLGGTNQFQLSQLTASRYWRVRSDRDDIIAAQFFTRYAWADTPPQELSTLGGSERLRGFQEGRFRDRLAVFAQAEYRWQTWERVGFVGFAGGGQVASSVDGFDLGDMRYSVGAGLRLMIIPSENVNLRLDYGFGLGPSRDQNFYLGIAESF